jgi:penicillin-insensitive murein endopeptidase
MRLIELCCAVALAAGAPMLLFAQDGGQNSSKPGASKPVVVAAKRPVPSKKSKKKVATKPAGPPAKELFGAAKTPAALHARSIGFYAKGCLAGAAALPIDGVAWQAMRLSRNRNWGHPDLVTVVEKLGVDARKQDGWPGLLVGDMSQPRGGPMSSGHASHQVGLDADIWLTPMPDRRLTEKEREDLSATSMLAEDQVSVDPKVWTEAHVRLLKRAASTSKVERIFVHPAIKKALCEATAKDSDRAWLHKVRAYWGHYYHFHVRITCPKDSSNCQAQPPLPSDDGCGKELTDWLALVKPKPPKPGPPVAASPPKPGITLDQLPAECRAVLASGSEQPIPAAATPAPASPAPTAAAKPDTTGSTTK